MPRHAPRRDSTHDTTALQGTSRTSRAIVLGIERGLSRGLFAPLSLASTPSPGVPPACSTGVTCDILGASPTA